jgi:hypothetical protein
MHVVAIVELSHPVEAEAAALAADLGSTAYEERLKLAAGLPAIVLTSADPAPAQSLLQKIRARGHGAVGLDASAVIGAGAMISMRRFTLGPDALTLPDAPGQELAYGDILGIFRAMHTTHTQSRTETTTKKFSPTRALLTGGALMSRTVKGEEKSQSTEREQVAYLFRASGETPWILRERGTNYGGLGKDLGPSSAQNFLTMIGKLRALAPRAEYSERLMTAIRLPTRVSHKGGVGGESTSVTSASGVDLMAHVMATWVGMKRG